MHNICCALIGVIILPPKQKFTKEEIVAASLNILRREGMAAITARALGESLGSSSRPIFTVFKNMDEVITETTKAARAVYNEYIKVGLAQIPAFKGVGFEYIHFAKDEPKLFQLLFMTSKENTRNLSNVLSSLDENMSSILDSVYNSYGIKHGLSKEQCHRLYQTMWIFTHGIASLLATETCDFTENEIGEMLTEVFIGLLTKQIKTNEEEKQ